MSAPLVHTSIIIRLLTGDDLPKQARSVALFQRIERGELEVSAPATVIADAVYVLASPRLYHLPREEVAALLLPLVRLSGFHVQGRRSVLAALQIYAVTPQLDFGDALIVAPMRQSNQPVVYSYDKDFDHVPGITRAEP